MTVALVITGVSVVALRSDSLDARSVSTAVGSLPAAGISVQRIEGHGRADGTQEIRFVFDGPLPSDKATYVEDIASFDVAGSTPGIGFTTQDVEGAIWVCDDRHFGFGPGASTGSIDLLIPADWFPPGMKARNDPVPWTPGSDPQTASPQGKTVACGPYKGYVQYAIWSPASDHPEDVRVSLERDSIRVVVETEPVRP